MYNKKQKNVVSKKDATSSDQKEILMEVTFETLNLYKEAGYDPFARSIYIWGEINQDVSYHFVSSVNSLLKINPSNEPITLYINSPGGDIYDMFSIIDYINFLDEKYGIKVNVYGGGKIMSAAAYILVACTGKRHVFKNTPILLHEIQSYSGYDNTSRKKDDLDHTLNLETNMLNILCTKTKKKNLNFWKKEIAYKDKIYSPDIALQLGLIDAVV